MSATITLEEAQAHLRELIGNLAPGEELVIIDNQKPVAKLVAAAGGTKARNDEGDRAVHGP